MNPVSCYEFTYNKDQVEQADLLTWLKKNAKFYCFQLERGDSGYEHWQGSFSLIKKRRKSECLKLFKAIKPPRHLEPLHDKDTMYFTKEDTRILGPWTDKDEEKFIPRVYNKELYDIYPWQQDVLDSLAKDAGRYVNLIVDHHGSNGKSWIAHVAELYYNGMVLPPINDADKLVYTACDKCMGRKMRDPAFFISLPRAMDKRRLAQLYTAIEVIKDCKLYDLRNKYKEWWIEQPVIWVFTNTMPDTDMLSPDRWRIYKIEDNELKRIKVN